MSFTDRSGSRVAIGIGAGAVLGLALGSLLFWLPAGVIAGAIWEKRR